MKAGKNIFSISHIISAIVLLLALCWLTISTPFVYADQKAKQEMAKKLCEKDSKEDGDNPLSNSSEEKTEIGVTTLSEYLHEVYFPQSTSTVILRFFKCHPSDLYFAYHPELLSPPPEA
jgi:hypothetical protein